MLDLISREALLNDIQAAADNGGMGAVVAGTLKRYVKRAPAVDAVEVVRCIGCRHCEQIGYTFYCYHWSRNTDENGYCHEGV